MIRALWGRLVDRWNDYVVPFAGRWWIDVGEKPSLHLTSAVAGQVLGIVIYGLVALAA